MTSTTIKKCYSELISIPNFNDRLKYLMTNSIVGRETFGSHRYLNQKMYSSVKWRKIRSEIIIRDNGCDLAHPDYEIGYRLTIHHINPITIDDILCQRYCIFDPENLVCCSFDTHEAIHYGDWKKPISGKYTFADRRPNDTCLWR